MLAKHVTTRNEVLILRFSVFSSSRYLELPNIFRPLYLRLPLSSSTSRHDLDGHIAAFCYCLVTALIETLPSRVPADALTQTPISTGKQHGATT